MKEWNKQMHIANGNTSIELPPFKFQEWSHHTGEKKASWNERQLCKFNRFMVQKGITDLDSLFDAFILWSGDLNPWKSMNSSDPVKRRNAKKNFGTRIKKLSVNLFIFHPSFVSTFRRLF